MKSFFFITCGFLMNLMLVVACIYFLPIKKQESSLWWITSLLLFIINLSALVYLKIRAPKEHGKQITHSIGASLIYSLLFGIYVAYILYSMPEMNQPLILFLFASFIIQKVSLVTSIVSLN